MRHLGGLDQEVPDRVVGVRYSSFDGKEVGPGLLGKLRSTIRAILRDSLREIQPAERGADQEVNRAVVFHPR